MGLFSNNKKLCPICGNPTPRLLASKIEGVPICKECDRKVDLPNGMLDQMTLDQFRQYLDYYENNQTLRRTFTETYRYDFGFFSGTLLLDTAHRLLRLKTSDDALVLEAPELKSFCILEDDHPLFEGTKEALYCHESFVPERTYALAPQIDRFQMQRQEFEHMEHMARMMDRADRADRDAGGPPPVRPYPTFDISAPVSRFYIKLTLENPYWKSFNEDLGAPDFDRNDPSVDAYLYDYVNKINDLHTLAVNLMQVLNPNAPEKEDNAQIPEETVASEGSVVEQIKQYKILLDAGALTEEEFAAKKKQLLGI